MDLPKPNNSFNRMRYTWRQVSDVVGGSTLVKQAHEVYLPMPSGMRPIPSAPIGQRNALVNSEDYQATNLPWWHPNPAYRAYLQRARFPDMTANTLRGLVGVATRNNPEAKLPPQLEYLMDVATPCGKSLFELFGWAVAESVQFGKTCLVLDVNGNNEIYIATYSALTNLDWKYSVVNGRKTLVSATFREDKAADDDGERHKHYFIAPVEADGVPVAQVQKFINGDPDGAPIVLLHQGKPLATLPIIFIGAVSNNAEPDIVPLLGISDIALEIYRNNADGSQARFLTCNPTLFVTGVDAESVPKIIGSTVVIGLENPSSTAFYPATDTSALEHISNHIRALFEEAVTYGSHFLSSQYVSESGEALKVRQSSNGATLIHIVNQVGKGILDALLLAGEWTGAGESVFEPSLEFAEVTLSAQDVSALVSSWMNGAISHDTLLDNLRYAGVIDPDKTNEQEKSEIETEKPALPMGDVNGQLT